MPKTNEEILQEIKQAKSTPQPKKKPQPHLHTIDIAIDIGSGIGVGFFIGFWLDKLFKTPPIFIIICLILGFLGGVKNMINRLNKKK